ncbi:MAG: MOSC domain-containing protein YiiM [Chitinophagales bacterium]|jgi:MOSC domain-containing protein YiiM
MNQTIESLLNTIPQVGKVTWIGLRPERRAPIDSVQQVQASTELGLQGDRYSGSSGKRHVTLIQHEHLPVIASAMALAECPPELLRRNISVSGINLLALKGKSFKIGRATLKYTGLCHPCSFMETTFGPGGYNAVRGHGGITAQVIESGEIAVNNSVYFVD